jgi:type II secretory pathway component GspD/PulD (secretin)
MPIQKAFESISSKVGLTADTDSIRKLDIRLSGKYEGKLLEIMNVIAKNNQIVLKLSTDSKTIKFSQQQEEFDNLNKLNLSSLEDIEFASHDFETLRKKLTSASNEITDLIPSIKSKLVIGMAKDFVYEINTKLIFRQRDEENSELRKALITYAENSNIENLSLNLPKTVAIFDPKVENGNERVIEKFSVYNDTPEAMAKLLQDYSIFKQGCTPATQNNSSNNTTVSSSQSAPATNASVSSATVNASSVSASSVIGQNTPINLSNNSNASANENNQSKNTTLVTQTEPVIERIKSGCVIFNKDSTGIIAAGSIVDVQLVERILLDQDRPIKQAMIEVFILEVNSDWRQQIQSKISTQAGYAGTQDFSLGMQSLPGVTTGGFVTLNVGGRNQIQSLVNLIETNLAGRKISNPLILVKDGQTGVVNKVRTARAQITSPATVSAGVTTPATTQVVDLPSPLTLTVTPKINKHNDNIDLNFSFSETTLDSDSVTSPTTQNQITSQLTIQPGQVIVMAGLKKETNSKQSDGLPFISGLGLKSVLGPIAGLFGGNYSAQQTGSELLVLIYPTVITNQTLGQTLNRAY